tara:strand:- start:2313 stop:3521 length:1209 start_codon:yes stop_codon:yes gene_type:complete
MADLRQILSQGRKRIGLLVGAGAPLSIRIDETGNLNPSGSPLIPDMNALTHRVIEALEPNYRAVAQSIRTDLGENSNIELILSRVRLLQQAIGSSEVGGLNSEGYAELGSLICTNIGQVVGAVLPEQRTAYGELVSWIGGTLRPHPIEIFTTNYDLLFEEAFEVARAPYFDGFSGGTAPFFDPVTVAGDDLPSRWSRLWKLHGSVGWAIEKNAVVRGRGREATQLVYPDHLKYDLTQKQPYASLFERLKDFLLTPDTLLLATGFSFRDAHVCAVLDEALAMNANASVFGFQYNHLENEEPICKLAYNHPNLSVYAADKAVINGVAGAWRPGELPKNWAEIRASFWGARAPNESPVFLLGDFAKFARFCALSQAKELSARSSPPELDDIVAAPDAPSTLSVDG